MGDERQLTRRGHERKQKLLTFATTRFAENGYHLTSVAEIVEGIGVGKGVFYWYFDSKEDLMREILREGMRSFRTTQAKAISESGDPLEKLEVGVRSSMLWQSENAELVRIVQTARNDDAFSADIALGAQIMVNDTAQLVQQAIDLGQILSGDAVMMAQAIRGAADELIREYTLSEEPISQEVIDTAVRVCMRGLQG